MPAFPPVKGVWDLPILDTPIAVFDFETTGLVPGPDRVLELSVLRVENGKAREICFDSLINPRRRVSATEIHGITDDDVSDAPHFEEVADELVRIVSGCVLAAYNVYFDFAFLQFELERAGFALPMPHLCLMYLRPLLGLGKRCALAAACIEHGIAHSGRHRAADDASSAAALLELYCRALAGRGIRTYRELAQVKNYKFCRSFEFSPIELAATGVAHGVVRTKSRSLVPAPSPTHLDPIERERESKRRAVREYWDRLKVVVSDLEVSDEEVDELAEFKGSAGLLDEEVRMLHARLFAALLQDYTKDDWLDRGEAKVLRRIRECLHRLGWAPGD